MNRITKLACAVTLGACLGSVPAIAELPGAENGLAPAAGQSGLSQTTNYDCIWFWWNGAWYCIPT